MITGNPYQILDDILNYYSQINDGRTSVSLTELILNVETDPEAVLFLQGLDKLVKEGYFLIEKHNEFINYHEGDQIVIYYALTYEGALLIKEGGYTKKKQIENRDLTRKAFYDKIVLVGAIIGGLYALFEIWKDILDLWFHYDFISN